MLKVLLIDDSATTRMLLSQTLPLLSPKPLEIVECETAILGLQELIKNGTELPDLIVTDLKMPHMSGEEFLQTVKAHPNYKKIPVVILSGTVSEGNNSKLKSLGALTVIPKPPPEKSLAKVLHYIQKSK